jgi:membrane-bound lytic murein transglycosylase D
MPRELALLPVIESAFEPYAYSSARAAGCGSSSPTPGGALASSRIGGTTGGAIRSKPRVPRSTICRSCTMNSTVTGCWRSRPTTAVSSRSAAPFRPKPARRQAHRFLAPETARRDSRLRARAAGDAPPGRQSGALRFGVQPYSERAVLRADHTGGQIDLQVVADHGRHQQAEDLYTLNPAFHRWATDPTGPHSAAGARRRGRRPATGAGAKLTPEQRMRIEHYTVRRRHRRDDCASVLTKPRSHSRAQRSMGQRPAGD